jgi:hypothetical protein
MRQRRLACDRIEFLRIFNDHSQRRRPMPRRLDTDPEPIPFQQGDDNSVIAVIA